MRFELTRGDRSFSLSSESTEKGHRIELAEPELSLEVEPISEHLFRVRTPQGDLRVWSARGEDGRIHVEIDGDTFCFEPAARGRSRKGAGEMGSDDERAEIRPPMPGRVVKIQVVEGESVEAQQVVAVVEAMKMELELLTPIAGRVAEISAGNGELIDTARPLIVVEAEE